MNEWKRESIIISIVTSVVQSTSPVDKVSIDIRCAISHGQYTAIQSRDYSK